MTTTSPFFTSAVTSVSALHRAEHAYSLSSQVAQLAQQCCDFNANLLDPRALSPANQG
jgi:hypothetical protein